MDLISANYVSLLIWTFAVHALWTICLLVQILECDQLNNILVSNELAYSPTAQHAPLSANDMLN